MSIQKIHDELFDLLYQHSQTNSEFRFRPRRTNRSNKLEEGYWFLGHDEYLAVGFWTGDDWRTSQPSISFMVNSEGKSWIQFSSTDMDAKFNFIINTLFPALNLESKENEFRKQGGRLSLFLNNKTLYDAVNEFLMRYYSILDLLIKKIEPPDLIGINIIEDSVFKKDIQKILNYRREFEKSKYESRKIYDSKISGFVVQNYGPIKHLELQSIPAESQWVFLTGENGVGKSSILKALSSAVGYRSISNKETSNLSAFECKIYTHWNSGFNLTLHRMGNNQTQNRPPLLLGFAAYGPFRISRFFGRLGENQLERARRDEGHFHTLFNYNGLLLDLDSQFVEWKKNDLNQFENKKFAIKEFLEGILLNVGEVEFSTNNKNLPVTLFREKDGEENLFDPVVINELSSGYLSILAMMSDLLVRLYRQQPSIDDPSELKGVVFIDEIDIHLHPKFQKHFVQQLTAAFPKVQFIVTTHSPIPLLGAPKNSVIGVVKRNVEKGTYIERVDDKIYVEDLLPNTILTSPIFEMDDITNDYREEGELVRTEKTFEELRFVDKLGKKIEEFMTDEKEQELIQRFKNRRK